MDISACKCSLPGGWHIDRSNNANRLKQDFSRRLPFVAVTGAMSTAPCSTAKPLTMAAFQKPVTPHRFLSTGRTSNINWIALRSPFTLESLPNRVAGGAMEPLVGVIMSSRSDWKTIQPANKTLASLGISHELRIISTRKPSDKLRQYAESAAQRGIKIIIVCEGDSVNVINISDELESANPLSLSHMATQPNELRAEHAAISSSNATSGTPVCGRSYGQEGARKAALLVATLLAELSPSESKYPSRYLRRADSASAGLSTAA